MSGTNQKPEPATGWRLLALQMGPEKALQHLQNVRCRAFAESIELTKEGRHVDAKRFEDLSDLAGRNARELVENTRLYGH